MSYLCGELLYEGKAKQVYSVKQHQDLVILKFKDSLTAFNAQKKDEMKGKGQLNLKISNLIFDYLESHQVATHRVELIDDLQIVVRQLTIIPLEVVIRNVLAGSTAKRFGRKEGELLARPLVEFYLKDDDLGDPLMTSEQADVLGFADIETQRAVSNQALKINDLMKELFAKAGIRLIDFKLEFGRDDKGQVFLADEISPDSCRLWDAESGEKMDKDRFRRDLGGVLEGYQQVLTRLETVLKENQ